MDASIADGRLDVREAREVVEATGSTVSGAEAKILGDLYERGTRRDHETPIYATRGAIRELDKLFVEQNLPFGSQREAIRQDLANKFESIELGEKLSRAPRVSSYVEVVLRDRRPVDGTRETVFMSPVSDRAYLRVDGGGRGRPRAEWFGPFDLKDL